MSGVWVDLTAALFLIRPEATFSLRSEDSSRQCGMLRTPLRESQLGPLVYPLYDIQSPEDIAALLNLQSEDIAVEMVCSGRDNAIGIEDKVHRLGVLDGVNHEKFYRIWVRFAGGVFPGCNPVC